MEFRGSGADDGEEYDKVVDMVFDHMTEVEELENTGMEGLDDIEEVVDMGVEEVVYTRWLMTPVWRWMMWEWRRWKKLEWRMWEWRRWKKWEWSS